MLTQTIWNCRLIRVKHRRIERRHELTPNRFVNIAWEEPSFLSDKSVCLCRRHHGPSGCGENGPAPALPLGRGLRWIFSLVAIGRRAIFTATKANGLITRDTGERLTGSVHHALKVFVFSAEGTKGPCVIEFERRFPARNATTAFFWLRRRHSRYSPRDKCPKRRLRICSRCSRPPEGSLPDRDIVPKAFPAWRADRCC